MSCRGAVHAAHRRRDLHCNTRSSHREPVALPPPAGVTWHAREEALWAPVGHGGPTHAVALARAAVCRHGASSPHKPPHGGHRSSLSLSRHCIRWPELGDKGSTVAFFMDGQDWVMVYPFAQRVSSRSIQIMGGRINGTMLKSRPFDLILWLVVGGCVVA